MIERAEVALGGFAVDLFAGGHPVARRVPIKKFRAPLELCGEPVRIASAEPLGEGVRLVFSDGEVRAADPFAPLGEDFQLVLYNAACVLTMKEPALAPLGRLAKACVGVRGGRVVFVGPQTELETSGAIGPNTLRIDAGGGMITPGLIDAHTHPVFGGARAAEFALRAAGKTYGEIHAAGGGIFSTVQATRSADGATLLTGARTRLSRMLAWGTTTCEGKSGYSLLPEGELALLGVLAEASAGHAVDISPTLLAHALPPEYAKQREAYIELFTGQLIREAVRQGLAESCDVFCDQGAFTLDETRTILTTAKSSGLWPRVHAEQLGHTGAAELAAQLAARSADHLEYVSDGAMVMMARAGVVATLLPGAALTLRLPWPPARKLLDAGVRVALGTDCNPGSSMTECLPLQMSLACMQLGMTVEEAWAAVTLNAARALGRADLGQIVPGARADLCIFACDEPAYVPYHYATNHLRCVIKDGQVAWRA
jgi:imidazolonepropionase